jgi:hypothetical protein
MENRQMSNARKEQTMWVNMTTLKVDPSNVDKLASILDEACRDRAACQERYLLHSAQTPGTVVSLTIWSDQASQLEMFQSEDYVNLVKQQLMPMLKAQPERAGFHVVGHAQCGCKE